MDENLEKDLMAVFKKHGLKADDVTPESKEVKEEETPKDEKEDSKVVANLSESIAKKLATVISKNKGHSKDTQRDLNDHIKAKVFTPWGGLREVEYPSDLSSLSKEEKIVNFFKALVFSNADPGSQQVLRALVEGTDNQGGYEYPFLLQCQDSFSKYYGNSHFKIGN